MNSKMIADPFWGMISGIENAKIRLKSETEDANTEVKRILVFETFDVSGRLAQKLLYEYYNRFRGVGSSADGVQYLARAR